MTPPATPRRMPLSPGFLGLALTAAVLALLLPLTLFTSTARAATTVSIWPTTAVPATASVNDRNAHELGVKFRAGVDGQVTGVRFYKGSLNTGTHLGRLWASNGTQLASATFTNETKTGWQTVSFGAPVSIRAGVTYIASYYAPTGGFSLNQGYFTGRSAGSSTVSALATGTDGPNGVYRYRSAGFPTSSYADANYWVDVVFSPVTAPAPSPSAAPASPSPSSSPAPVASSSPTTAPTTAPTASTAPSTAPSPAPTTTAAPAPASAYGPTTSPAACSGTTVRAGSDVQAAINAAPTGTTLCLQAGTYRLASALSPRSGQTLWGAPGTVLTGSVLMTNWTQSGSTWIASGHLPAPYSDTNYNPCQDTSTNLCKLNEWAFADDVPLRRVASASAVVPGTFYTDYANNRVHVGDNPAGRRLELSRTKTAISSAASSVTLRGLTVDKFATGNQRGAVVVNGGGWLLRDNEIRFNHGAGIYVYASNTQLRNNRVHHNGTTGIAAYKVTGLVVDRNELDHNNTDGSWINDGENGGYKSTNTTDTVTNNWVHHNTGLGLWFDINNNGSMIDGNLVTDNASDGIRYEISYNATIRNNTVLRNGLARQHGDGSISYGAGILVSTSSGVQVYGNTVRDGDNGIGLIAANRGSGTFGTYVLQNVKVYSNTVGMTKGATGLIAANGDSTVFTSKGVSFSANSYTLPSLSGSWFRWANGSRTASQWQGYGNDTSGTFSTG